MKKYYFLLPMLMLATAFDTTHPSCCGITHPVNPLIQDLMREPDPVKIAILKREFKNGLRALSTAYDKEGLKDEAQAFIILGEILKDLTNLPKTDSAETKTNQQRFLVLIDLIIGGVKMIFKKEEEGTLDQYPLTNLENFLK